MLREAPKHPIERALRRAEQERDRTMSRLRRAYGAVRAACWEFNLSTNEIDWSDEFYDLYSIDRSIKPSTEGIYALIHPDDLEATMKSFWEALGATSGVDTWQAEYRLPPSGGLRWIRVTADIERGPSGHATRVYGVSTDVTELKRLEREHEELREAEARFRLLADCAPVMVWKANAELLCDFFNKPWLDFTGRTFEQEWGNGWAQGVHPDDREHCVSTFLSTAQARKSFTIEYRLRRADGEYRWILDNGVPLSTADGGFMGYIGSCIDITDLKGLEAERLARARAEAALQARDEFIGIVTHDIRSPLGAIKLSAEMLERMAPPGETGQALLEMAHRIRRGAETMHTLVDDLVDVASIAAGKLRLQLEPHDPRALVDEAIEMFAPIAKQKSITLKGEVGDAPRVRCDRNRIFQVLSNLISNALKFTDPNGAIQVTARAVSNPANEVCFSVSDTGRGIPPEQVDHIFERFFQGAARGRTGAGLGLYIARGIVCAHGGRIWAESEVGKGTTLSFTVPTA
jgi:PAS domain S-box-containing protein